MEYSIIVSRGNMPSVKFNVEADNAIDAIENRIQLQAAYQDIGQSLISDIYADIDDCSFPIDEIGLKYLDNGEVKISFDNSQLYVLFREREFLRTARVLSENGEAVDSNCEESKLLMRNAADWMYMCGFYHIASNNAQRLH